MLRIRGWDFLKHRDQIKHTVRHVRPMYAFKEKIRHLRLPSFLTHTLKSLQEYRRLKCVEFVYIEVIGVIPKRIDVNLEGLDDQTWLIDDMKELNDLCGPTKNGHHSGRHG